jgi:peptidyl-tRNA hydrolase, PTH1 family
MWKKIKEKFSGKPKESVDYLFVGLGNPGEKYKNTAHNSGFRVASLLREEIALPSFSKDKITNSLITKGMYENKKVVIILPLTYMNLSGIAVKKTIKRFNFLSKNLVLIHDDTDLQEGTVRFSFSRGSAGHKGVASVINHLKTKDFTRVRIGVRKEEEKSLNVVLKKSSLKVDKGEELAVEEIKKAILSDFPTKTFTLEK